MDQHSLLSSSLLPHGLALYAFDILGISSSVLCRLLTLSLKLVGKLCGLIWVMFRAVCHPSVGWSVCHTCLDMMVCLRKDILSIYSTLWGGWFIYKSFALWGLASWGSNNRPPCWLFWEHPGPLTCLTQTSYIPHIPLNIIQCASQAVLTNLIVMASSWPLAHVTGLSEPTNLSVVTLFPHVMMQW